MEQEMQEVEELFMMRIEKRSRIGKKQTMTSLPYYLTKAYQTP